MSVVAVVLAVVTSLVGITAATSPAEGVAAGTAVQHIRYRVVAPEGATRPVALTWLDPRTGLEQTAKVRSFPWDLDVVLVATNDVHVRLMIENRDNARPVFAAVIVDGVTLLTADVAGNQPADLNGHASA
jgi:hypothetical protein